MLYWHARGKRRKRGPWKYWVREVGKKSRRGSDVPPPPGSPPACPALPDRRWEQASAEKFNLDSKSLPCWLTRYVEVPGDITKFCILFLAYRMSSLNGMNWFIFLYASYTVQGVCYASGTALCPESKWHSLLWMVATQVQAVGKAKKEMDLI